MRITVFQVDAFTDEPGHGNPAAVCVLPEMPDDEWLQRVALEMNLSETAFVLRKGEGHELRWFTPLREVELCGHATLAASHVLWQTGRLPPRAEARFSTKSGALTARSTADGIVLDFPATPDEEADPGTLPAALGTQPEYVGRSRFDFLVAVADETGVRAVRPDFRALAALPERGVIVTAPADGDDYDFVSRYFAPAYGIDEDPVTGSAHCTLGPYWQRRTGRDTFAAFQASARGGAVGVRMRGRRVELTGRAVTVMQGELLF